jgi:hypothetical protein
MKTGPRPKRSKGTWFVSVETSGKRGKIRTTEPFQNERDAKTFAKAKLANGSNMNAGTLNPYRPKRLITSAQISDWLNEPDDR